MLLAPISYGVPFSHLFTALEISPIELEISPIGSVRSGYPIEGAAALGFRHAFFAVHRA